MDREFIRELPPAPIPPEVATMTAEEKRQKEKELQLKQDVQMKVMEFLGYRKIHDPSFKQGALEWVGQGKREGKPAMDEFRDIYNSLDLSPFQGDVDKIASHITFLMDKYKFDSEVLV